jgi:hypothetical protein
MKRRVAPLLLIAALLAACSVDFETPFLRPYVEIVPVDGFTPCCVDGVGIRARVVQPFAIHVLRGFERNVDLIAHELVHVMQWQRYGAAFPAVYLEQVMRYGYRDAPLEVEARNESGKPFYQRWAVYLIARLPSEDPPAEGVR